MDNQNYNAHQFNHVCKWIQIEILLCKTLKERGKFMKKAIRMAKRCMDNQNYNALCAINTALNAAPIFRLTHAWNLVKKVEIKVFEQIKELFSHHKNQKKSSGSASQCNVALNTAYRYFSSRSCFH